MIDEELYCRIRAGDKGALEDLYERREPGLFRYGLQLSGNRALAEEAAQEAFLQLIRPDARFDPRRGSLEAYLYGAVRNLIRGMLRTRPEQQGGEATAGDDVERKLIDDEAAQAIHRALQELPAPFRDAVFLCDLEERSYEEAARVLACPVGTVRSRVHRGRQMLAAKLSPLRGGQRASGAAALGLAER